MLRGKPSVQAIEPDAGVAHISDMSGSTARTPPSKKHASGAALKYRGVALQTPSAPPHTPLNRLQHALDTALAKHADALAGGN